MDHENSHQDEIAPESNCHTEAEISCLYKEVISETEELRQLLLNHLVYLKKPKHRQWLTSSEAQKYLRISKISLKRCRDNQTLPYKVVLGRIRYQYEDVLGIMQKTK